MSNKTFFVIKDDSTGVVALEEWRQTYSDFLGDSMKVIHGIRECPVKRMTLCVTSEIEMEKCVKMKVIIDSFKLLVIYDNLLSICIRF